MGSGQCSREKSGGRSSALGHVTTVITRKLVKCCFDFTTDFSPRFLCAIAVSPVGGPPPLRPTSSPPPARTAGTPIYPQTMADNTKPVDISCLSVVAKEFDHILPQPAEPKFKTALIIG